MPKDLEEKLLSLFQNGHYQGMEAAADDMLKGVESGRWSEAAKAYLLTRRGQAKYMQVRFNSANKIHTAYPLRVIFR